MMDLKRMEELAKKLSDVSTSFMDSLNKQMSDGKFSDEENKKLNALIDRYKEEQINLAKEISNANTDIK